MNQYADDQFARRVCFVVDLLRGEDGDGGTKRPFFDIAEIRAIFRDDQVRLSTEGGELLCAIANTVGMGMLGMASNIFRMAKNAAKRQPKKIITAKLVWNACERVLLPTGVDFRIQGDPIKRQINQSLDRVRRLKAVG